MFGDQDLPFQLSRSTENPLLLWKNALLLSNAQVDQVLSCCHCHHCCFPHDARSSSNSLLFCVTKYYDKFPLQMWIESFDIHRALLSSSSSFPFCTLQPPPHPATVLCLEGFRNQASSYLDNHNLFVCFLTCCLPPPPPFNSAPSPLQPAPQTLVWPWKSSFSWYPIPSSLLHPCLLHLPHFLRPQLWHWQVCLFNLIHLIHK